VTLQAKCKTPGCPEIFLFQIQRPLQSFLAEPCSPKGTWPLLFVCPSCRYPSSIDSRDIDQVSGDQTTQYGDAVLWSIVFACSENNCGLPIRLQTIASKTAAASDIERLAGLGLGHCVCGAGHKPLGISIQTLEGPAQC
jgi:hypothetical protein